jgi:MbtH protein
MPIGKAIFSSFGWALFFQKRLNIMENNEIYLVVVNHEEQYSIWPEWKKIPNGWEAVGKSGQKEECLDYIKEVWTDMRPLSVRKQLDIQTKQLSEST